MRHILDRPIWNALSTLHAHLSEGDALARRYRPGIVPFIAVAEDSDENREAMVGLVREGEQLVNLQRDPLALPAGLSAVNRLAAVQMVLERPVPPMDDPRIKPLSDADSQDMLDLALLTKPGPFTLRAQSLGDFCGIRIDGRLAAMCGQRWRQPGYVEASGLCTHPDFQGRGLGRLLLQYVASEIKKTGDEVFLHTYASNTKAIKLYEALGFALRSEMNVTVITK